MDSRVDVTSRPSRKGRRFLVLVGAIAVATGAASFVLWHRGQPAAHAATSPTVPVTVSAVARRDVPIFLGSLGTVQASNTVAVHSQIDGKLQSVAFVEGQEVHKGDTLAVIDPRALQAALDQAVAKKAQDQAQLIAAQKDLDRFKTSGRQGRRDPTECRPAAGQGRPAQSHHRRRPGRDRERADPAVLHNHHGTNRRPRRLPSSRCRQHHPRQ